MIACTFRFLAVCAIAVVLLLCAGPPCRAFSFSQLGDGSRETQEEEKAARKFDEFPELLGECDLGARLDNFAIQLQIEPKSKGFIIVYSGKYDLPAIVSSYRANAGNYLVNSRGINPERLVILDGGYRQILTTQLWITPQGTPAPELTETINVKQELDKAFKFSEERVSPRDNSQQFGEELVEFSEPTGEVGFPIGSDKSIADLPLATQEEIDAAAQAHSEESEEVPVEAQEEETVDDNVWWASKAYARALEMEAKASGLIIFYADREHVDFSRMKEIVELGKTRLIEKFGVKAERLTLTFGGYRRESAVELWLVPANAPLPLPTPDPEKQEQTDKQAK